MEHCRKAVCILGTVTPKVFSYTAAVKLKGRVETEIDVSFLLWRHLRMHSFYLWLEKPKKEV
jgi:hypothetical protein